MLFITIKIHLNNLTKKLLPNKTKITMSGAILTREYQLQRTTVFVARIKDCNFSFYQSNKKA